MNVRNLLLLCLLAGSHPSQAFVVDQDGTTSAKRWELVNLRTAVHTNIVNRNTRAVRYFLASDGYSPGNVAAELNAIRASFAQWQTISGTILKFEEGGLVAPGVDVNTDDNTNVIFFATTSKLVNGGMDDISGRLGLTFSSFYSDGDFAEGDIVFNGVDYEWYTDYTSNSATAFFIEGVALHEIGHFIGLNHSPIGGATMLWVGGEGIAPQVGLAADEVSATRFLYPQAGQLAALATLRGQVTRSGSGVFGAAVLVEDNNGIMIAGTVTGNNGFYELSAMAPGSYQVRVAPLDPDGAGAFLARGSEIATEYNGADTSFLPTATQAVNATAGTNTLNLTVANGTPAFRITEVRAPTFNPGQFSWSGTPISVRQGQSNITVGVVSADLPTSAATLSIPGVGVTVGNTIFHPNLGDLGINFMSVVLNVASNAPPGPRSFLVQQGANRAYANGFLDIAPAAPDYNFDGLDDLFQRKHFPLFTTTNAGPGVDPDGDMLTNAAEYVAGTNPTNAASRLQIDSVAQGMGGTTVTFRSVAGKRYQLYSRALVASGTWLAVGAPVTAAGAVTPAVDPAAVSGAKFYRVAVLP